MRCNAIRCSSERLVNSTGQTSTAGAGQGTCASSAVDEAEKGGGCSPVRPLSRDGRIVHACWTRSRGGKSVRNRPRRPASVVAASGVVATCQCRRRRWRRRQACWTRMLACTTGGRDGEFGPRRPRGPGSAVARLGCCSGRRTGQHARVQFGRARLEGAVRAGEAARVFSLHLLSAREKISSPPSPLGPGGGVLAHAPHLSHLPRTSTCILPNLKPEVDSERDRSLKDCQPERISV